MALDRQSVIEALTDGIGVHFGRASRRSFFEQLDRLERHPIFRDSTPEEQQGLADLLALAAFYQCVIVPINSSANFISVLRRAGATHLRVAGDKLDQRYANRALAVATGFKTTLRQAKIPEKVLTYATINQFVRTARHLLREGEE
jgi:signal-transduction protein with cAMP-binding, CBS, and nucleotidyltransferase domain